MYVSLSYVFNGVHRGRTALTEWFYLYKYICNKAKFGADDALGSGYISALMALWEGNLSATGRFPAQRAMNAETFPIFLVDGGDLGRHNATVTQ